MLADVKGHAARAERDGAEGAPGGLAPRVSLSAGGLQSLDRAVEVGVRCSKACYAVASGRLVAAGKSYRLKAASRGLTAGRKRTWD